MPRFLFFPFLLPFYFIFAFFSISTDDMGATSGGFSFGSFFFLGCGPESGIPPNIAPKIVTVAN